MYMLDTSMVNGGIELIIVIWYTTKVNINNLISQSYIATK